MLHDDQHIKQPKGDRGNHEEVHRREAARVVLEKSLPALGGLTPELGTILPDGGGRGLSGSDHGKCPCRNGLAISLSIQKGLTFDF